MGLSTKRKGADDMLGPSSLIRRTGVQSEANVPLLFSPAKAYSEQKENEGPVMSGVFSRPWKPDIKAQPQAQPSNRHTKT
ncbi:hypothetical protein SAE02_66320 [Skermanella aerolata]|uniref:Uncharacterized protein n=1 Tax=Skermanella aerolata TaxID=393310 RepID=A0A512E170_9PROT|nr:hypothetical protein SAE02_66320 [Skermanella aerolata]